MPTYLMTGGSGRLGSELRKTLTTAVAPSSAEMNILDAERVQHFVAAPQVSAVLHLAAVVDTKTPPADTLWIYQVNVCGTAIIAAAAARYRKPLVYISTDYVFSGKRGEYRETDPASPPNLYGYTKYAGELEIQNRCNDFLIIRTGFRPNAWPFPTAYDDVCTSVDYVDVIARDILLALQLGVRGVLHIGTEPKTLFELAQRRNPQVRPEAAPPGFPKRKDLCIDKWLSIKKNAHI